MGVADQVFVMDLGGVIASGPPEVVKTNPRVIDIYLGKRAEVPATAVASHDNVGSKVS
jgi:ABC-type uncharacterized transport system ATPase subunit